MSERELELALKVIELMELRDSALLQVRKKLLDQNKSYRAVSADQEDKGADARVDFLMEKIVKKHKTVSNILRLLAKSEIQHDQAVIVLTTAIVGGRTYTEEQVRAEAGKL